MPARFRLSRRARPSRSPSSISSIERISGLEFLAPPTKVYSPEYVEGEFCELCHNGVLGSSAIRRSPQWSFLWSRGRRFRRTARDYAPFIRGSGSFLRASSVGQPPYRVHGLSHRSQLGEHPPRSRIHRLDGHGGVQASRQHEGRDGAAHATIVDLS